VLLISLDTLRADRLTSYGYERETSPFLDELASRGIRFSNVFVNTLATPSSHATMLTSLYQETHGVDFTLMEPVWKMGVLPPGLVMLQEILQASGWVTIGVTEGAYMSRFFGFARGFEEFTDEPRNVEEGRRALVEAIRRHTGGDRPIFAFFHTYQVHTPYWPPQRYREQFGRAESPYEPTPRKVGEIAKAGLPPEDVAFLNDMYDAEVRFLDDRLRRLFDDLEALGFLEDYLLLITSDHGEEFGEHGALAHHGKLYEELIHVPLIVTGTGVPSGVVDDRLASLVDVMPTVLARLGLTSILPMAGRDLLAPPAADEGVEPAVFSQFRDQRYAVRTRRWKLIENFGPTRGTELYDLLADPGEGENLADREGEVVRRLRARLESWRGALPSLETLAEGRSQPVSGEAQSAAGRR
jgi:arylsulfatase A-like enzyme